jgi:hypothetical protein
MIVLDECLLLLLEIYYYWMTLLNLLLDLFCYLTCEAEYLVILFFL